MATKAPQADLVRGSHRSKPTRRSAAALFHSSVSAATCPSAELAPGVRDRLIARLIALGLPQDKRVSFVAGLTGCAPQTVRRWLADSDPGLPDLRSFATLCRGLRIDADELIGLDGTPEGRSDARDGLLVEVARCVHDMACALGRQGCLSEPVIVPGDEMAPRLREGDLAFVETDGCFAGNGLYAFEHRGEVVIRRVEKRPGRGWLLKCDNRAYGDSEFAETGTASKQGLRLLGKVRATIALRVFR